MDKNRLWKQALAEIELILSKPNYKLFFSTSQLEKLIQNEKELRCVIAVPNAYIKDSIQKRYLSRIKKILERLCGKKVSLDFLIKTKKLTSSDYGPLFERNKDAKKKDLKYKNQNPVFKKARLQPYFTFDSFAVSSSNEMAYAACKAVARSPGQAYNPLFLYGGVGVGKTHLMQATAQSIIAKNEDSEIIYCTGEEFTNEIIEAIQSKKTSLFRRKFRSVKLLLIDDIQFIAGKNTVQEEFFHTFNAINQGEGQIILSSDRPPYEIQKLEERLASRFEAGLIVDIQEPNFELRTAILLIKAKMFQLVLPMDLAQLIAGKVKSTRQLEGTLIRLKAFSNTQKKAITPELIKQVLKISDSRLDKVKSIKPREVISQVAQYYNLKVSQLKSPSRQKDIILPRQVAMFLLRNDARCTLLEVAGYFGKKDHTTVMHSVGKIKKLISISEEIRLSVNSLRKSIW